MAETISVLQPVIGAELVETGKSSQLKKTFNIEFPYKVKYNLKSDKKLPSQMFIRNTNDG